MANIAKTQHHFVAKSRHPAIYFQYFAWWRRSDHKMVDQKAAFSGQFYFPQVGDNTAVLAVMPNEMYFKRKIRLLRNSGIPRT